ncbi:MAG: hypothetical protein SH857_04575 [Chitinophagales bacterium]|nr:hypothetical protein [Chitinophagales bacterium]
MTTRESQVFYFEDGSTKEENYIDEYVIEVNADSSIVAGYVFHMTDSIKIDCKEFVCSFTLSNGLPCMSFSFEEFFRLEYELLRVKSGLYNYDFKKLQAN